MTDSASSLMAIVLGLGVFAVIVAVGWRSVQKRRILRLQGANGQETIILAREGDDISNVVTTTAGTAEPAPAPAPSVVVVNAGVAHPESVLDPGATASETMIDVDADAVGRDRLSRVVSSTE